MEFESILHAIFRPVGNLSRILRFAGRKMGSLLTTPAVEVSNGLLEEEADQLARMVRKFGSAVERLLITYREDVLDRQLQLGRIADVSTELYVSTCVLNRLDEMLKHVHSEADAQFELATGKAYLAAARRRMRAHLKSIRDNDDDQTLALARSMLRRSSAEATTD